MANHAKIMDKFSIFILMKNEILNLLKLHLFDNDLIDLNTKWHHFNIISPFNRLYFIFEGEAILYNYKQKIMLTRGKSYLIPLNTIMSYTCDNHCKQLYFHFNLEIAGKDLFESTQKILSKEISDDLVNLLKDLYLCSRNSIKSIIRLKGLLTSIIGEYVKTDEKMDKLSDVYNQFKPFYI